MALRDGVDVGILAILRGATLHPAARMHRQFACSVMGSGIGALVDAGLTDQQIMSIASEVLTRIRAAVNSGDPFSALRDTLDEVSR